MAKILALLLLSMLLFAAGLSGSLYLRSQQPPDADDQGAAHPPQVATGAGGDAAELPVALHAQPMSADEVFRFAASIRGRERELQQRREAVEQQEARLRMMQDELRAQRREIDGVLAQIQDASDRSASLLEEIKSQRRLLQQEQSRVQNTVQATEQARTKREAQLASVRWITNVVQNMSPDTAAKLLKDIAGDGQLETVIHVMATFEERKAAAILEELQKGDSELVNQLTRELSSYPRPAKARLR